MKRLKSGVCVYPLSEFRYKFPELCRVFPSGIDWTDSNYEVRFNPIDLSIELGYPTDHWVNV